MNIVSCLGNNLIKSNNSVTINEKFVNDMVGEYNIDTLYLYPQSDEFSVNIHNILTKRINRVYMFTSEKENPPPNLLYKINSSIVYPSKQQIIIEFFRLSNLILTNYPINNSTISSMKIMRPSLQIYSFNKDAGGFLR